MSAAFQMYAMDYDDCFSHTPKWMDATLPYTRGEEEFYRCSEARQTVPKQYGYAFNSTLIGRRADTITKPEQLPLLYDSANLARNACDPVISLILPGRHDGGNTIGYADGHTAWYGGMASQLYSEPRRIQK